ncbi:MAG: PilZ domain-containing protein [Deltaproteobacteria bacterium]|nr:PilZ domain-containing protein [Deltaproteobacteria bacterium]MBW2072907.1 PilZ domain-containing protein [Deltaproteobacteria bacterium]
MESDDRRVYLRLKQRFDTTLRADDSHVCVWGVTENLGQGGAFIKTADWKDLQPHQLMTITLFIPPDFSGHDSTIALQGTAVIVRTDLENEGIAVRFVKELKLFERVDQHLTTTMP